jgi:hypothetical protein
LIRKPAAASPKSVKNDFVVAGAAQDRRRERQPPNTPAPPQAEHGLDQKKGACQDKEQEVPVPSLQSHIQSLVHETT